MSKKTRPPKSSAMRAGGSCGAARTALRRGVIVVYLALWDEIAFSDHPVTIFQTEYALAAGRGERPTHPVHPGMTRFRTTSALGVEDAESVVPVLARGEKLTGVFAGTRAGSRPLAPKRAHCASGPLATASGRGTRMSRAIAAAAANETESTSSYP